MSNQLDKSTLKIQALLEKVSNLTANYENDIADLRVELTVVSAERDELQAKVNELSVSSEDQKTTK